jgi:Mg-chelatase subunit ChlD
MRLDDRPFWVSLLFVLIVLPCCVAVRASAQPAPVGSDCVLQPAKSAAPSSLRLGERTTITLATTSSCPPHIVPLHVVLSLDASSSMERDGKLDAARTAAKQFVERMDLTASRVGVTTFAAQATVAAELTDQPAALIAALDGFRSARGTNIAAGIDASREVLQRGRTADPRQPIESIVVMSDGRQSDDASGEGTALVLAAADRAKADGILMVTICFGEDCAADVMRQAASRPDLFFHVGSGDDLSAIFQRIAGQLAETALRSLSILDLLPDNMRYITGSAEPAPSDSGPGWLKWSWDVVPPAGVSIHYQVEPLQAGRWPTNIRAVADFVDTLGLTGQAEFPVPEVLVVAPTPPPTPTPRATPVPVPVFLPITLKEHCDPLVESTDVALVIDVSDSMNGPTQVGGISKREAARRAAVAFVAQLRLPADQVAVIAFSDAAQVLAPLGASRAQVTGALQRLPQSTGTRIDAGLAAARQELTSTRRRRSNHTALLLLTDGRPTRSGEDEVRSAALAVRQAGMAIFTIGLGADVNPELLADVAGGISRYTAAPRAEDLERIYGQLARVVPCPAGRHDWSRPWP